MAGKVVVSYMPPMDPSMLPDCHFPCLLHHPYSVYAFGKQCGWKIHLLKLPSDAVLEETRQKLANKSRKQLIWSKQERLNRIRGIAEVRDARQAILKQDRQRTEAHHIHRRDHIAQIFTEKADMLAETIETRSVPGQSQEWLASVYGPESYWAKKIANDKLAEAKLKEAQEKAASPRTGMGNSEIINEKGELDFRCLGGKLMSVLEEKRVLAHSVEVESKVPIGVWAAITAQQDKAKAKDLLRELACINVIQKAVRRFRERKW